MYGANNIKSTNTFYLFIFLSFHHYNYNFFSDNAYAIKCYSCAYPGNDNCNDEFKSTGITIEDNCASCSKLKGEANGHTSTFLLIFFYMKSNFF